MIFSRSLQRFATILGQIRFHFVQRVCFPKTKELRTLLQQRPTALVRSPFSLVYILMYFFNWKFLKSALNWFEPDFSAPLLLLLLYFVTAAAAGITAAAAGVTAAVAVVTAAAAGVTAAAAGVAAAAAGVVSSNGGVNQILLKFLKV